MAVVHPKKKQLITQSRKERQEDPIDIGMPSPIG
jgi:hypothetical protein